MLGVDHKNTVLREFSNGEVNPVAYTVYGHPGAELPIKTRLRYNGEFTEPQTGWQLLGKGHRAYNPVLMRFHTPDNLSPFGEGGRNSYTFVLGDPMGYSDSSGNAGIWKAIKKIFSSSSRSSPGRASTLASTTFDEGHELAGFTQHTVPNVSADALQRSGLPPKPKMKVGFDEKVTVLTYEQDLDIEWWNSYDVENARADVRRQGGKPGLKKFLYKGDSPLKLAKQGDHIRKNPAKSTRQPPKQSKKPLSVREQANQRAGR